MIHFVGYLVVGNPEKETEKSLVLNAHNLAWSGAGDCFTGEAQTIPFRREPIAKAPIRFCRNLTPDYARGLAEI